MTTKVSPPRDRSIKDFIKTLEGFPRVADWSRPENDRMSTMEIVLPLKHTMAMECEFHVYYSYALPVAFSDPRDATLYVIGLDKDSPCRTRTTMRHISAVKAKWNRIVIHSPGHFAAKFRSILACGIRE